MRKAAVQCPKCEDATLAATQIRDIEVDRCPSCHGVWFDEAELPHLLSFDHRSLTPLEGGRDRRGFTEKHGDCPRDRTPLLRVYSAQNPAVVVDACPACRGIWLDAGELDQLLRPEAGRR
jgi:Zn-finger nucleic acid-binding protein